MLNVNGPKFVMLMKGFPSLQLNRLEVSLDKEDVTGVFDFARTRTRTQTTDHGPSPTSNSPIKRLGPRTESDNTGKKLSLRFLYTDRVRGKTSDHGPSLTSNPRYQTLGPRTESMVCSLSARRVFDTVVVDTVVVDTVVVDIVVVDTVVVDTVFASKLGVPAAIDIAQDRKLGGIPLAAEGCLRFVATKTQTL
ncbi:hypothetical protein LXL04_013860 [Taraxacum kok-saghyz]